MEEVEGTWPCYLTAPRMASACAELQQLLLWMGVILEASQDKTEARGKTQIHMHRYKHIDSSIKELSKTFVGFIQWHCSYTEVTTFLY